MTLQEALENKWKKQNGEIDHRMVNYCIKTSIYIQSGDIFINCGVKKPRIEKDMWYDDETDAPKVTFEGFKALNMHHNAPATVEEQMAERNRKPYIVNNYYLRNGETTSPLKSIIFRNEFYDRMDGYSEMRPATDEELELAREAIAEARADYEKRLEQYWKRYSNKVMARGYWVNR